MSGRAEPVCITRLAFSSLHSQHIYIYSPFCAFSSSPSSLGVFTSPGDKPSTAATTNTNVREPVKDGCVWPTHARAHPSDGETRQRSMTHARAYSPSIIRTSTTTDTTNDDGARAATTADDDRFSPIFIHIYIYGYTRRYTCHELHSHAILRKNIPTCMLYFHITLYTIYFFIFGVRLIITYIFIRFRVVFSNGWGKGE